jgi:uncharacterized protein YndB with AHSA1/START domain
MHTTTSEITIEASPETVWKFLTDPELVKMWQYGSLLITTWEPGTSIRFRSEWEGQVFEQWGTVIEVVAPSLFAPRPDLADAPENYFYMSYTLTQANCMTTLRITQEDSRPGAGESCGDANEEEHSVLKTLKELAEAKAHARFQRAVSSLKQGKIYLDHSLIRLFCTAVSLL